MVKPSVATCHDDLYDLSRFTKVQRDLYDEALSDLKMERSNPIGYNIYSHKLKDRDMVSPQDTMLKSPRQTLCNFSLFTYRLIYQKKGNKR